MIISYEQLKSTLADMLLRHGIVGTRAELCATIFADSTLDGFHSHGVDRFAEFIGLIRSGYINTKAEPKRLIALGNIERWDGQLGPGPLNAWYCMERAIALAKKTGMGCVALQNTNHWMRGGTYSWQAAEEACISLCFTNTKPNMPLWGGKEPRTGNNPLIVGIPGAKGHIILDMALTQFSYGKMATYQREGRELPFAGGFDTDGQLTSDPGKIGKSELGLPIGLWKGAGLSIMLDFLATLLSGGRSTFEIGKEGVETGLSQCFLVFDPAKLNSPDWQEKTISDMLTYLKSSAAFDGQTVFYPGERTLERRLRHRKEGIPVDAEVWRRIQEMLV